MDKEMKSLLKKWGIGGAIVIILVPIAVNLLMIPKIGAVGQSDTWITFFGSYIGAILSGLLTLIGVLLTINYTVKQNEKNQAFTFTENLENIKFTRDENIRMLQENRKETRRNKLPEMIYNLEVCLDFLEEKIEEINKADDESLVNILTTSEYEGSFKMFLVDKNYNVVMRKHTTMVTKMYLRKIRNVTVKADVPAYDTFLKFKENLNQAYTECISPISRDFSHFRNEIIDKYFQGNEYLKFNSNATLNNTMLSDEEQDKLIKLKRVLFLQDAKYIARVSRAYLDFEKTLQEQLYNLVSEYNNG